MPVCIAGMHRSGTSLAARLLNLAGLYLGAASDLPAPGPDNPAGFWEHTGFAGVNEAVLAQLGGGWDLPPAAPIGWETAPALAPWREQAAELIRRMQPHEPWGWKDPRNSLTLPFWQSLIPGLKVVICLRNPLEVAQSLHRRNRTSLALGLHLWLTYTRRLLAKARPEDRVITHYDAYFHDPRTELRRVHDRLGLPASPEAIDRACRSAPLPLRHFHATRQELMECGASAEVVGLYLETCAEAGFSERPADGLPGAAVTAGPPPAGAAPDSGQLADIRAARLEAEVRSLRAALDEIYVSERWRFARSLWPVVGPAWTALIRMYRSLRDRARAVAAGLTTRRVAAALGRPGKHDLVVLPIIDWRYRFQRPQQLARQFARQGHRCFYVQTTFHPYGNWAGLNSVEANVFGLQLPGPPEIDLYRDHLEPEAVDRCLAALDEVRQQAGIVEAACLVQLPFWAPLALAARERWGWKIVYDCLDEHAGFARTGSAMAAQEAPLMAASDLVVASSRALHEKAARLAGRALWLPNAADFDHFSQAAGEPGLPSLPGPVIGYYGAIAEWFDVEMVRAAAAAHPEWQFALIGRVSGADVTPLRPLPNVHLLGEQPYAALPAWLGRFDVACIPFRLTALTQATNPVKFYEYLSAGKPVVATALPDLEPWQDLFYPVRTAGDFSRQIEAALAEDSAARAPARVQFARDNAWPARGQALRAAIAQGYGKAVIVVVSYRQPDYLRQCLESLWAKTIYPNFEVVVVDNGSGREVRDYLQACAAHEPRLRLILHEDNQGFARACNAGLRAAGECAYVALLNNDTVVTRGWLSRLIRRLQDPAIGLVGPVTNWAGNEARIRVGYRNLAGLDRFAERQAREHAGQSSDISVLALYCAVMRKSVLDEIGPLDERYGIGLFEDDDYSLRLKRAGYRLACAEDAFVHHWGRASFGRLAQADYDRLFTENRKKFEEKWGLEWQPHRARRG